jgi:hypothetical protein
LIAAAIALLCSAALILFGAGMVAWLWSLLG